MILSIFLVIIGLSLALLIIGFAVNDTALQLVGLAFLFISGLTLAGYTFLDGIGGTVEYKSGETTLTNYTYLPNNSSINNTTETKTYDYTTFSNATSRFIGTFLAIVSMLASAVIFTRLKDEDDD